jgi:hypothetical protein
LQTHERLKSVIQKYQSTYGNSVELRIYSASGRGEILLDTSRGGDISYEVLMSWATWKDLEKQLWRIPCDFLRSNENFPAKSSIVEDCRPNSYYKTAKQV